MALMWFMIGVLAVIIVVVLRDWNAKNQVALSWPAWLGIVLVSLLALFGLAWFVSSLIEDENQAAGMGLLFFGGLSMIIFALTRKRIKKDIQAAEKQ